jgi:hypothetical protein
VELFRSCLSNKFLVDNLRDGYETRKRVEISEPPDILAYHGGIMVSRSRPSNFLLPLKMRDTNSVLNSNANFFITTSYLSKYHAHTKGKIWLMTFVIVGFHQNKHFCLCEIQRDFAEMNAVVQMVMMINKNMQDCI